jgi:hypothetical protein
MLLAAILAVVLAAAAPTLAGNRGPNNSGKGNSGNNKDQSRGSTRVYTLRKSQDSSSSITLPMRRVTC